MPLNPRSHITFSNLTLTLGPTTAPPYWPRIHELALTFAVVASSRPAASTTYIHCTTQSENGFAIGHGALDGAFWLSPCCTYWWDLKQSAHFCSFFYCPISSQASKGIHCFLSLYSIVNLVPNTEPPRRNHQLHQLPRRTRPQLHRARPPQRAPRLSRIPPQLLQTQKIKTQTKTQTKAQIPLRRQWHSI